MGELLYMVFVLAFGPPLIGMLLVGIYAFFAMRLSKKKLNFSIVRTSFFAALRLQMVFVVSALIFIILFKELFQPLGPVLFLLLLICTGLVGLFGALYCFACGVPIWLQWKSWRELAFSSP